MSTATLSDVTNMLKAQLETQDYLDVGKGAEIALGISQVKLNTAIAVLRDEGYEVYRIKTRQVGMGGAFTTYKILAKPGTTFIQARSLLLNK